jgi:transcriptional regulator with XRE-family HTH domain
MNKFQKWLMEYLKQTGMTNVECGERFGVNDSLIGHYLRGTRLPTYTTLQKIRNATDIDMNDLFE